jgi:hypothetical protein
MFIGEKVKRDYFVLDTRDPELSDFIQAGIDVGDFILNLVAYDSQRGLRQHVPDEVRQTHTAVLHFGEHLKLLLCQRSELLRD